MVDLCLAVFLSGFSFIQPGQTSVVALVQTPSLMMTMNTMMLMMVNMAITQEAGDGDDQTFCVGKSGWPISDRTVFRVVCALWNVHDFFGAPEEVRSIDCADFIIIIKIHIILQ